MTTYPVPCASMDTHVCRHDLPHQNGKGQVVVGWDNPLRTFFAQAVDSSIGLDNVDTFDLSLWAGAGYQEITTVEQLRQVLRGRAEIPADLAEHLEERTRGEGQRIEEFDENESLEQFFSRMDRKEHEDRSRGEDLGY